MKILYISQYFPPEMGAPAARASELARHWADSGHDITILTGFPNHPTGIIAKDYRGRFWRLLDREKSDGVNVVRTWLLPFPNRKTYERILNYASFGLSAAFTGMFLRAPDVVIATSPQLLVALAGWWVAKWKRVPFVFEVRDLWPESLAAVGAGAQQSVLYRTLAKIAGFLYRRSDKIVVVTPAFLSFLIEHWSIPEEKICVVENGVETTLFSPQPAAVDLRESLGAEDRFLVSYIGTVGMAHGLDTLLGAAEKLQYTHPNVMFMLVGEGSEKAAITSSAGSRGLTNVRFIGEQPRERVPDYIRASDVCLVMLRKSDIFKTVIPTKMLEFMACGRPAILGVEGQARTILEAAKAGIAIEPENAHELAEAIVQLVSNPSLRETMGKNGRRYVVQNCSRKTTANIYLEHLQSLVSEKSDAIAVAV
jgi:glycosyltransferase involved in cell wall biosynthesis